MPSRAAACRTIAVVGAVLALALPAVASASLTTAANGPERTGWYPDAPQLSPSSVAAGQVHQAFSASVQGQVYAQPLVANGTLLVATQDNWIYGLDPNTGAQKWARQLGSFYDIANDSTISSTTCPDIQPHVGITSTPVIDSATNTAYLFAKNPGGSDDGYQYNFHAIDLSTGQDRFPPTAISGQQADNTSTHFHAHYQLQRPGLLLMNGVVYAAFGAHCDVDPSQGWIVGVSTSGQLKTKWTTRSNDPGTAEEDSGGGIWQDGGGIVSDGSGQILVATGSNNDGGVPGGGAVNCTQPCDQDPHSGAINGKSQPLPSNLGESVVRLQVQPDGTLRPADFFSPHDAWYWDMPDQDTDMNSGGPVALPDSFGTSAHPHLFVNGGKSGDVFLLDRDNLGGFAGSSYPFTPPNDNVIQRQGTATWPYGPIVSRFAVWPGDGGYLYSVTGWWGGTKNGEFGSGGPLNVYKRVVDGSGNPQLQLVSTTPSTNTPGQNMGYGSSGMSISSNGTAGGSAVAWMVWQANSSGTGAELRAYDAVPQNGQMQLLWSTPIGQGSKFNPPAISDNHVYVGTRDGHVLGFAEPDPPPSTSPTEPAGPGISLTSLKISPHRFAPATKVTETRNGRKRTRRVGGATVRFTSSAAGIVELRVERRTTGRRAGRRCVRLTRHNRRRKHCTLWRTRPGTIRVNARAGANRVAFTGRLRGRKLALGSYRLVVRPVGAQTAKRTSFRIVKLKRRG